MIDIALCPAEVRRFEDMDLSRVTAVVFDVLRATSSMVMGLEHGVERFFPVDTVEKARARKAQNPDLILAGERRGLPLEGFDLGNSPQEFKNIRGKSVVITTTNGTVALHRVRRAEKAYIGALLNLDALAKVLTSEGPSDLLLVCAGTGEQFAIEDAIAAGALIDRLPNKVLSDAALLVHSVYQQACSDLLSWLRESKNGRALTEVGKSEDIEECARTGVVDSVGVMADGAVVKLRKT